MSAQEIALLTDQQVMCVGVDSQRLWEGLRDDPQFAEFWGERQAKEKFRLPDKVKVVVVVRPRISDSAFKNLKSLASKSEKHPVLREFISDNEVGPFLEKLLNHNGHSLGSPPNDLDDETAGAAGQVKRSGEGGGDGEQTPFQRGALQELVTKYYDPNFTNYSEEAKRVTAILHEKGYVQTVLGSVYGVLRRLKHGPVQPVPSDPPATPQAPAQTSPDAVELIKAAISDMRDATERILDGIVQLQQQTRERETGLRSQLTGSQAEVQRLRTQLEAVRNAINPPTALAAKAGN